MSINFSVNPKQKESAIFARIRKTANNEGKKKELTNIKISTGLKVDTAKWEKAYKGDAKGLKKFREANTDLFDKIDGIEKAINARLSENPILDSDEAKDIINRIVNAEAIQAEKERQEEIKRQEEESKRITLSKYIDSYLADMVSGARQTPDGKRYAYNSIKSTKQSFTKLREYQRDRGIILDFDDIDMRFHRDFSAYLMKQDYSINTIGKCFKDIKSVMEAALSDGLHDNVRFKDKSFKASKIDVDSIYLTESDLKAILSVDLSALPKCYEQARDIFLVGVYTAQRVSDYNNITKDCIKVSQIQTIEDNQIITKELVRIELRQQKTGAKVSIPCKAELRAILEKYDYSLPHLWEQKINDYIKVIGEMAGLTDLVEITSTKGGKEHTVQVPKYTLIHTHTARRTGATLMYLAGIDVYDIMKITGHSSPKMLKKYIKADTLEVAEKIADRYEYFK